MAFSGHCIAIITKRNLIFLKRMTFSFSYSQHPVFYPFFLAVFTGYGGYKPSALASCSTGSPTLLFMTLSFTSVSGGSAAATTVISKLFAGLIKCITGIKAKRREKVLVYFMSGKNTGKKSVARNCSWLAIKNLFE